MLFFAPDPDFEDAPCTKLTEEEREIFFGKTYKKAQAICQPCPVKDKCLERALEFEWGLEFKYRYGVWGGKSITDRMQIEKQRRSA